MGSCGGGVIDLERLRSLFRFRVDVSLREAFGVFSVISKSSSSLSEERKVTMSAACQRGNSCCLFGFFLRCLGVNSGSVRSPQSRSSSSALSDGVSENRIAVNVIAYESGHTLCHCPKLVPALSGSPAIAQEYSIFIV